jgi:uncharacterized DUF497 family protein
MELRTSAPSASGVNLPEKSSSNGWPHPRTFLALTIEDESAEGERRFVTLGANTFGSLMVVVWTPRDDDVRIISVRKPTPKERRSYEEGV